MRNFWVFLKKEALENIRTKKLLVLAVIMLYAAFISAPTARFLPELLKSLAGDMLEVIFKDPTYGDAFGQFFKNVSQLGIFALVFLLAASVSKEKNTGSAIMILTKPITRGTMVLAKFTAAVFYFSLTYFIAFIIHVGYTYLIFGESGGTKALIAALMMWYYCVLIIAVTISCSAICKKSLASGLISFGILFVFTILSSLPILNLNKYSPGMLASINQIVVEGKIGRYLPDMLTGNTQLYRWSDVGIAAAVTTVLIVFFLAAGIKIFEKQEI